MTEAMQVWIEISLNLISLLVIWGMVIASINQQYQLLPWGDRHVGFSFQSLVFVPLVILAILDSEMIDRQYQLIEL